MYIVTGAAGFIGSNIVKELNARGIIDILAVDDLTKGEKFRNLADTVIADYMDISEFYDVLQNKEKLGRVNAVLHNGACADTMEYNGQYMFERNFTYSKAVFEYATYYQLPLVYASSASVYGTGRLSTEEPEYERPINVYAYSKLAFDQFIRQNIYRATSSVVGLRYFNVYGPREAQKGRMASMVFQIANQLKETGKVKLFTGTDGFEDGGQMRDFVSSVDVARVNLHFAATDNVCGIFNVGTGKARSFNEVAHKFIKLMGEGEIEYVPFPDKLVGKYQSFTEADLTKLRDAGYTSEFMSLEEGIDYSREYWGI